MNGKEFKLITSTSKDYVGHYIKYYRERIGLSQVKLAEVVKSTAFEIGAYEQGIRIPDKKFLDRLYKGINKYVEKNQIQIIR